MLTMIVDKSLCDTSDIISDSSGVGTANSDSITLPGTSVVCIENYSSSQPGHLRLSQGDILEGNLVFLLLSVLLIYDLCLSLLF